MFTIRKASDRGYADHGWLTSYHSFSFANYYDPAHMGFSKLRVINEDTVAPGMGFGTHGHRDMEIISYAIEGEIAHKDSQGNIRTLPAGEFQLMSAGSGITHSEYNLSKSKALRFLQIWIEPDTMGQAPSYQQKGFGQSHGLTHIASPGGENDTLQIKQNMHLHQLILQDDEEASLSSDLPNFYIHSLNGRLDVSGQVISPGDGLKITNEQSIHFKSVGVEPVKALIFELP